MHAISPIAVFIAMTIALAPAAQPTRERSAIAHRGASAYAPEHTRAAYDLAVRQGADYVEQDLGVTKDGVLVCVHDDSLERTTDVETVFPDRFVTDATGQRRWMVADFTLAEIKRLDAGSWFGAGFAGERILTWDEAVEVVGGRAGLYPELKSPAAYRARGVDLPAIFAAAVKRTGGGGPRGGGPRGGRPGLIVQSFDPDALRATAVLLPSVPRVFLVAPAAAAEWLAPERLKAVRAFAGGIGPDKRILLARPALVAEAHAAGLTVTPYTFRSSDTGTFADVADEMRHYLDRLGVDAVFTDNPDRFPRR